MQVSLESARDLSYSIQDFYRTVRSVGNLMAQRGGQSTTRYRVLKLVSLHSDFRAVDLAQELGIGQSVLSRHLADLETMGLIHRGVDEQDRRVQRLWLTTEGKNALAEGEQRRVASLQQALAGWTDDEARQAADLLNRLGVGLDEVTHHRCATDQENNTDESLAGAQ